MEGGSFYGEGTQGRHRRPPSLPPQSYSSPSSSQPGTSAGDAAWNAIQVHDKLDKVLSLVQKQNEETEAVKKEVVSMRAELDSMKKDRLVEYKKRSKLPTDLSVS